MPRPKQPRLLSPERIPEDDEMNSADFLRLHPPAHLSLTLTYRCPRRHAQELPMQDKPPPCPRCGEPMKLSAS
jgi:hypothetical protein